MSFRHLLLEGIHENAIQALQEAGHAADSRAQSLSEEDLIPSLALAEVLGVRSKTQVTAAAIENADSLLAIGCYCIGTNQVDLEAAARQGIAVFNAPFSNTRSVAELTLAEIICLHRRLTEKSHALHTGGWDKSAAAAHEVRGRTLGIIGYGHIGSQLSVLAEAVGMRVIYYDIANKLPLGNAATCPKLAALLAQSDVVSLHVPATSTTEGMIDANAITNMKHGAFLINNARGAVVDLDAVADAVRSGHLGGAALDVYPDEPSGSPATFSCPLAGLPNVILTPHIGGSTEEAQANIAIDVTMKVLRYLQHGSTADAVNVPRVDLPHVRPNQPRILHFHRNVPGVLSKMHSILADASVNINAEYLQSTGDVSYVILDVDPFENSGIVDRLRELPETVRMRVLG